MKKVLSIILSLVLVLVAMPMTAIESSAVDYYTSPDGEWTYYVDGNGDAVIYSGSTSTSAYLGTDANVVVPSTIDNHNVVSLGQYTFNGNTNLQSIVLPNTLATISNHVFRNCTNLTSVTFGNSVGIIGANAFEGCTSLESITIPNTVTSIGAYAFSNMTSLKNITVPGSVTTVGDRMFEGCTALEEAIIGNGVPKLSGYMFHNCSSLENISIPDSVTLIGYECFWNCTSIESLNVGNSVQTIDTWAFENCSNLKSLYFPATLTTVGGNVFSSCNSLNAVYITDLAAWCNISFSSYPLDYAHNLYLNGTLITDLVIPNGVTEIKKGTFSGCTPLTSVTMSDTVQTIGNDAFRNCSNLTSVYVSPNLATVTDNAFENDNAINAVYITDLEAWCGIAFSEEDSNPLYKGHNLYVNNVLSTVTVPNTVTQVKQYVFTGIDNDVVLSNSVTSIGKCVFFKSTTDSVILNNGLLSIGESAFNSNTGIIGIEIPDTVTSIGAYAFSNMTSLKSITVPGSVTTVGDRMFEGCTALEEVTIGNGVPKLSSYMFHNCSSLESISVSDGVISVDYECFWNCTKLKKVVLPGSVETFGNWAFENCSSMKYLVIPDGVTSIPGNALSACNSLTNIICYKDSYAATYNTSKATFLGDMNFDGIIDIDDIGAVMSASVGLLDMTELQELVADYNIDTAVDGFDAAEVDNYVDSLVHPRKATVSTLQELQDAIEIASVNEIIVTTAITLPDGTVLDGAGKTVRVEKPYVRKNGTLQDSPSSIRVFTIESGSTVTVKNMTVMSGSGGDAAFTSSGNLTLENVNVTRSRRGLYNSGGTAVLKNCNFSLNVCSSAGAIWTGNGSKLVLDGCSFTQNRSNGGSSSGGGAIGVSGTSTYLYANNTVFAENASQEIGGAINIYSGNVYMMNCTIAGNCTSNSASYGGGIGKNGGTFYAVNCMFVDNYATIKSTPTRSDIGKYSGNNSILYNCLYTTLQGSTTETDCKADLTDTVASEYAQAPIILSEGTKSVNFLHPVLSTGTNRFAKYVTVNPNGNAASGGTNTYFDYSDLSNVKMGYGDDNNILALGNLGTPDSGSKVASYFEGGTRDGNVIGASACN